MARLLIIIVVVVNIAGCGGPLLHPTDWGQPASATNLHRLAIVAMPSPRLDKPLDGNFIPSAYLARIAADHLKERVDVVDTSRASADTTATWDGFGGWVSMEQYLGRAREWYSESRSRIDYSDLGRRGIDGVVEIGIQNYEISNQAHRYFWPFSYLLKEIPTLMLQVVVKLVDPATGAVLGKARSGAYEIIEPLTAAQFKLTFSQMATTLTVDNLERIGLSVPGNPARR